MTSSTDRAGSPTRRMPYIHLFLLMPLPPEGRIFVQKISIDTSILIFADYNTLFYRTKRLELPLQVIPISRKGRHHRFRVKQALREECGRNLRRHDTGK